MNLAAAQNGPITGRDDLKEAVALCRGVFKEQ
jgi:hypothetical protein